MSKTDAEVLRQPLVLPHEVLPNRLAKAAMTEGLANPDGTPSEALIRLYQGWARGAAGLHITGNVLIDRAHLERPGNVVLDGQLDTAGRGALCRWAEAIRSQGAGAWMQLNHAGRQTMASVNPTPLAPSAVPLGLPGKHFGRPTPMTEADITTVIQRFGDAAAVARDCGFTGVQVHAAHGYLLSQFLSPLANQRTDSWGGSLAGRARLLLEVVAAVRAKAGSDFTVAVKLNSADFQRGGFDPEESITVAGWLAEAGVHVLEISGGSYEQPKMMNMSGLKRAHTPDMARSTRAREAYFLDFAVAMRAKVSLPLMVTGGFRTAEGMARAVAEDGVAMIGLGRPLCVDPMGPAKILSGAPALEAWETKLRLGPGLLGPASPIPIVKLINGFGATYWFYQQIRRIAAGQPADPGLGLMAALKAEQKAQAETLAAMQA